MKKQLIAVSAVAGLALGAAAAHAVIFDSKGNGIVGSVHDMNTLTAKYTVKADTDRRLCAFCHTPHHAVSDNWELVQSVSANLGTNPDGVVDDGVASTDDNSYYVYAPLWSRGLDIDTPQPYTSPSFNPDFKGYAYDPLIGPSRLCLTCHDGVVALDSYYGKVEGGAAASGTDEINFFAEKNIAIGSPAGSSLMNDHPIGMKYSEWDADADYELNAVATTFTKSDGTAGKRIEQVLYNDTRDANVTLSGYVTCASCHDVHNGLAVGNMNPPSDRGYLLYGSQKNSSFCLACHDKNDGNAVDSTY